MRMNNALNQSTGNDLSLSLTPAFATIDAGRFRWLNSSLCSRLQVAKFSAFVKPQNPHDFLKATIVNAAPFNIGDNELYAREEKFGDLFARTVTPWTYSGNAAHNEKRFIQRTSETAIGWREVQAAEERAKRIKEEKAAKHAASPIGKAKAHISDTLSKAGKETRLTWAKLKGNFVKPESPIPLPEGKDRPIGWKAMQEWEASLTPKQRKLLNGGK
ncbi:hypothetical protein ABKN59_006731 [Abortiporus biennis]